MEGRCAGERRGFRVEWRGVKYEMEGRDAEERRGFRVEWRRVKYDMEGRDAGERRGFRVEWRGVKHETEKVKRMACLPLNPKRRASKHNVAGLLRASSTALPSTLRRTLPLRH
eukprot:358587-Chlamydomonas_euryale.AAC.5